MFGRMVWASLRARRARLALSLVAVMLGVAVTTALATLALQVGDDLARTLRAAGPNFVVLPAGARLPLDLGGVEFLPPRAGLRLDETAVAGLKTGFWRNNVLEAAPELSLDATIDGQSAMLAGAWFDQDVPGATGWRTGVARLHPDWQLSGRWPDDGALEVVLGRDLATRLDVHPGQSVQLATPGRAATTWRVTGTLGAMGREGGRAWTSLSRAQALAGRPGQVDRVWLSALVKPPPSHAAPDRRREPAAYERYMCTPYPDNVAGDLRARLGGADVLPMTELIAGEGMVVRRLNLLMLLLALAALGASALGLFSTSTAGVVERQAELGLLRALGATSGQISALLLGEAMLVSLAGGALGFLLGVGGAALIRGGTFGSAAQFPTLLFPVAIVLSLALALAGTIGPLRLALRIDPARVLRA
jgi:putative ABC transport system permease protein